MRVDSRFLAKKVLAQKPSRGERTNDGPQQALHRFLRLEALPDCCGLFIPLHLLIGQDNKRDDTPGLEARV